MDFAGSHANLVNAGFLCSDVGATHVFARCARARHWCAICAGITPYWPPEGRLDPPGNHPEGPRTTLFLFRIAKGRAYQ